MDNEKHIGRYMYAELEAKYVAAQAEIEALKAELDEANRKLASYHGIEVEYLGPMFPEKKPSDKEQNS